MGNDYRYYGLANEKLPLTHLQGVRLIAVDVETITANEPVPVGIGIAISPTDSFYFSLMPPSDDIPWELLTDPGVTKIMHSAPFDLRVLRDYGIDTTNIIDTAVMARMQVIPANLEDACATMETTTRPRHMKDVWEEHSAKTTLDLDQDTTAIKCCEDCLGTFELYLKLEPLVDMDYVRHEMELLPVLEAMSRRGILLDQDIRYGLEVIYTRELRQLTDLCMETLGLNPASPHQVGYILAKRGNFLPMQRARNTHRWSYNTSEQVLEKVMHVEPVAGLVLRHRHLTKMLGTYIRPLKGQQRAYTYFHLDAATARISSSNSHSVIMEGDTIALERNLQNIPYDHTGHSVSMRNMFLPDSGTFTDMDFSQIELRVLAHMSNDHRMMDILNDPNGDIHQETADFLGVPRKTAKNCTFAILYGATAQTVMETAHIQDIHLAQRILDAIFRRYPQVRDWVYSIQEQGRRYNYVQSLKGRKVSVVREGEEDDIQGINRKSSNYPIQMSAGEIMKDAELLSWERLRHIAPMAHQVHDEIMWDGLLHDELGLKKLGTDTYSSIFMGIAPFPTPVGVKWLERWE